MQRKGISLNPVKNIMGMWISRAIIENSLELPQKITTGSSNSTTGYISKGEENCICMRYLHSHVYCNTIHDVRHGINRNVHGWVEGYSKCDINTQRNIIQPLKYWNSIICSNWRNNIKWNKPGAERRILYALPYMWR